MPSDEETTPVKVGEKKRKLEQTVSPNTLVLSQPSPIRRRNSLPNLVQIDDTCIVDNRGNTVNLSKLIEDTIRNPSPARNNRT